MSKHVESGEIPNNDSEITLVDILVVLLRRWRLILGLTALTLVIGLVMIFVIPKKEYQRKIETRDYEVVVTCRLSSTALSLAEDGEIDEYVMLAFSDPIIILKAIKQSEIKRIANISIDGVEDSEILFALRQRLVENVDEKGRELRESQRRYTVTKEKGSFMVSVIMSDSDLAKVFLENLVDVANQHLTSILLPKAVKEISNFETSRSIEYPRAVIEKDLQETFMRYSSAISFASGEEKVLVLIQAPYILMKKIDMKEIQMDLIKKTIITVFAVFFFSVFLAFFLHWIENVRNDSSAMEKIHTSLKKVKK